MKRTACNACLWKHGIQSRFSFTLRNPVGY
jgi:hypothetical protein